MNLTSRRHFRDARIWRPGITSRLAAIILLLLIIVGGMLLITPVWVAYLENEVAIDAGRRALGRFLAKSEETMTSLSGGLPRQRIDRRHFLLGESVSVAVARLQTSVSAQAVTHGVNFESAAVLPPIKVASLQLVGVGIRLKGTQEKLFQTLHALETGVPFVFIHGASVEGNPNSASAVRAAEVGLQLDVYAAWWDGKEQ